MAWSNAGIYTTLSRTKAIVREKIGAVSAQKSGLFDAIIADVIHNAIMVTRTLTGASIDFHYSTDLVASASNTTATDAESIYNVSTTDFADLQQVQITDLVDSMVIPVISPGEYVGRLSLFKNYADGLALLRQAHFVNTALSGNNIFTIKVYRGSSYILNRGQNILLTFPRNPRKVTVDTEIIDLPEQLVSIMTSFACVEAAGLIEKKPPAEVIQSVNSFLQNAQSKYGTTAPQVS